MEVVHSRCAGLDISKKDAKVCVRVQGRGSMATTSTVTTWGSMTGRILALRDHLVQERVSRVVMEATGDYWKPFYYLFEDAEFETVLVNPKSVKAIKGRKSDVSDAAWLADLGAHGLVQGSMVPPAPIRKLRDLTRARTGLVQQRSAEYQRLEKLLEDAGIKLTSVASGLTLVSSRAMLEALIAGERDPAVLAEMAKAKLRVKIPALREALVGRFDEHHAFLAQMRLDLIDHHSAAIAELTQRIEVAIEPFQAFRDLMCTIPGVSTVIADVIVAETGADITVFPSAQQLCSWAGVAPGSNESAGRHKPVRTRPGNSYLKGALGQAAESASRTKNTYLAAKFQRIVRRRGKKRALVALQRSILTSVWHMATTGELYNDLGADYYRSLNPDRTRRHAIAQLEALGYRVTLQEAS
jgi:transposase